MLRNKDCRVLAASELRGDAKKRMTSCLRCNTAMSLVGRRNHRLTDEFNEQPMFISSNLTEYFFLHLVEP